MQQVFSELDALAVQDAAEPSRDHVSTTFADNMKLPVHRWFRYSAGFSSDWVEKVIEANRDLGEITVLDPYVGSGTTLIASDYQCVRSIGVEAHPFIARVAEAKLLYRGDPPSFLERSSNLLKVAESIAASTDHYPDLIQKCYSPANLRQLDQLRRAWVSLDDGSDESKLSWLALVCILRTVSNAGTAPWQYILPGRSKRTITGSFDAYATMSSTMANDMAKARVKGKAMSRIITGDARRLDGVDNKSVNLVITSPPYPNNYDYADATRLELSFFGEITGYSDLQSTIRQYLVRSCAQHMRQRTDSVDDIISDPVLEPIREELQRVTSELAEIRTSKGGRKSYHLMVAAYFLDMADQWRSLRRVCASPSEIYFVVGDSAPYGVYVPVVEWNAKLAEAAGFHSPTFEKTRDRNIKWKNRKHRVPLLEGRFRVSG